ncbi:DUF3237 domain-containing protein [Nocardioides sp. LHD-245]|uniref:DUF3237 domain-containing protein n=1 Tax=Nocardioides sp. LHD-245 TaxID=3051387 RepID=UPI0027DF4E10|nr:DUF3237 domain-containing protein [Nocardioides sp. LHD-245]
MSGPADTGGVRLAATLLFRVEATHDGEFSALAEGGPHGTRVVAGVTEGTVAGPRVSGRMVRGLTSDWVTVRRDGIWEIDVRAAFVTDDDATVLYFYNGLLRRDPTGVLRLRGAPRFQTGDERYAWLNEIQAVAIGEADLSSHAARYDVYALD